MNQHELAQLNENRFFVKEEKFTAKHWAKTFLRATMKWQLNSKNLFDIQTMTDLKAMNDVGSFHAHPTINGNWKAKFAKWNFQTDFSRIHIQRERRKNKWCS